MPTFANYHGKMLIRVIINEADRTIARFRIHLQFRTYYLTTQPSILNPKCQALNTIKESNMKLEGTPI